MHRRSQKTSVKPFKDFFYRYSNYPCSFSSKKTPGSAPILVSDSHYKEKIKLWFNPKIDDLTKMVNCLRIISTIKIFHHWMRPPILFGIKTA
ncbi:hypothetical protein NC652_037941 [Populus alba x Populus x berolinensis]|nr:hypothetical protein NC652_037941 [Populus alba x Populus x berolinensis]